MSVSMYEIFNDHVYDVVSAPIIMSRLMRYFSKSDSWVVRAKVADSEYTDLDILEALTQDKDWYVRKVSYRRYGERVEA